MLNVGVLVVKLVKVETMSETIIKMLLFMTVKLKFRRFQFNVCQMHEVQSGLAR